MCAQSAYRVHTAIVLSENERSLYTTLDLSIPLVTAPSGGLVPGTGLLRVAALVGVLELYEL